MQPLQIETSIPSSISKLETKSSSNADSTCIKMKRVVLPLFAGMAIELGCKAIFLTVVAVPLSDLLLPSYLVSLAIANLIPAGLALYREFHNHQTNPPKNAFLHTALKTSMLGIKFASMRLFNSLGLGYAIHEFGHASLAWSFYKNTLPSIAIFPLEGGSTTYQLGKLSKLGNLLGGARVELLITAAGLIASLTFAMMEFGLAQKVKDSHPAISDLLNLHALSQLLQEVLYIVDTLFAEIGDLGHDGMFLWEIGGIHPLFLLFSFLAISLTELHLLGQ